MRVLVIQTAYLGDVILTVPLISTLGASPRISELTVVASPPGSLFLEGQRVADRVLTYDKRGADGGAAGLVRLLREVRSLRPDVALVPHRSFRSALVAAASGASVRAGFETSGGRVLLTEVFPYGALEHEVERVASLVRAAGVDFAVSGGRIPFRLRVPGGGRAELARFLAERSMALPPGYVLVAPGSRWATKRWSASRFAEAAGRLGSELGARVVVTGADYDSDVAAEVAADPAISEGSMPALNLTGGLKLGPLAALVSGSTVVLSNDSAVAHIAAGLGVPVVSVFGPTVPGMGFAPYSERARVVEADVACRPCGRHGAERCQRGTHECMELVSADAVARQALELVKKPKVGVTT